MNNNTGYFLNISYHISFQASVINYTRFFLAPADCRYYNILVSTIQVRRSQWPRGLRRRSLAARLLRSWVGIQPGAWMFVCFECCMFSGRGLCDELITRPEESYRLWRVVVCDQETSNSRRLNPATGLWEIQPQWVVTPGKQTTNKEDPGLGVLEWRKALIRFCYC
jgi:hypothetical protein